MQQHIDFSTFAARFTWAVGQMSETQAALAKYMGASTGVITQWKTGLTNNFDAAMAIKAAQFLDVDVEWLVLGEGTPERVSKDASQIARIVDDLSDNSRQQTLDFIGYQIAKPESLITGEKAASYNRMIESIINDMKNKKP